MMFGQIKEFIEKRDQNKPFCLSVSFKAPHSEDGVAQNNGFRPAERFKDFYQDIKFYPPATASDFFYEQFSKEFKFNSEGKVNEGRLRYQMRFSPNKYQTTAKAIYQLISGLDDVVANLRQELEKNGLSENTIIVFTSDNGYYMGEHGLEGKWYGHQESIKVPLIIYDPRKKNLPALINHITLNIDLAPTFLAWANIPTPKEMQGKSLLPLVNNERSQWRDEFFYEHLYDPGSYPVYIPMTVGVTKPPFKYMGYYRQNNFDQPVYEELFNLETDSHEVNNLVDMDRYRAEYDMLKSKAKAYQLSLK